MADLPQDREKALEKIAGGWGRTATTAHPLCRCGKAVIEPPSPPIHDTHNCCDECNDAAWSAWKRQRDEAATCPMHPRGRR